MTERPIVRYECNVGCMVGFERNCYERGMRMSVQVFSCAPSAALVSSRTAAREECDLALSLFMSIAVFDYHFHGLVPLVSFGFSFHCLAIWSHVGLHDTRILQQLVIKEHKSEPKQHQHQTLCGAANQTAQETSDSLVVATGKDDFEPRSQ